MLERVNSDKVYLDNARWKCSKSPTGAHHWFIETGSMTCKYCKEIRKRCDKELTAGGNYK